MADSQSLKKNKKKKKKPSGNSNSSSGNPIPLKTNNCVGGDEISKDNANISDILPLKVGMSAMFKDVEVTMTKCEVKSDLPTSTSSKKKKKKKSKQISEEVTKEKDSASLLSFNENRIELVNHPEISVTVSKVAESKENELPKVENNSLPEPESNEQNSTGNSTKKKKKKKKKKNPETSAATEARENATEDNTYTSPTYVKLPASGDSLVLVVSHESFSNGSSSINTSAIDKSKVNQNELNTILPPSKKTVNNAAKQNPSLVSEMQLSNTVRVFPASDSNKNSQTPLNNQLKLPEIEVLNGKIQADSSDLKTVSSFDIANPENISEESKTKAQLKAERRAKQEAQRAAKIAKNIDKEPPKTQVPPETKSAPEVKDSLLSNVANSKLETESDKPKCFTEKDVIRKVRLFSHLPQCKLFKNLNDASSKIHPAILEVGYQYSKGIIRGSNARCIALLAAFSKVINSYTILPEKDFSRDLESKLQTYLNFLSNCRPLSVSMINAVKFLKHQINHVPKESDESKIKENLSSFIYNFVNDEVLLAKEAIGNSAAAKIVNGDVILVFSYSSLVKDVLCKAHNQDKKFQVIVVDSRPKMEGLEMLRRLVKRGLRCSYVSITALSYVMKEVSKVIIGAHALLSNGCVMSRLGCKQVALVASSYSVPVLVCCETYKFCERVLTDSFVHNELGEPEELVSSHLVQNNNLQNWRDMPSLQLLNLLYDVTPPDLISMVITEKGVLPCTSVPVVLRVRHAGFHE